MSQVHEMTTDPLGALEAAWTAHLRAGRWEGGAPRTYVYASGRRDCKRAMALDLLHPEDWPVPAPDALERMERGKEREASIVARLQQIGPRCPVPFQVIEGQHRFEVKDRDGTVLIVGKIDGRLRFATREQPVFEIKSGESFRRIETLEDFERSPWTRHAPDQLLSYLLAEGEPWGFFVIDRPGLPKLIRVDLEDHLDRAEAFLQEARLAIDAKAGKVPMPPFTQDAGSCRRCSHYGKSCAPPLDFGEGAAMITDERLIDLAEVRERSAEAHQEYEEADKELKAALRGIELGVLGPFLVSGKWGRSTRLEFPSEECKKQFQVVDPKGRFLLTIEREGQGGVQK